MNEEKIAVIGIGPVGLATALGFAIFGYDVICYDIDKLKIESYKKSYLPFYEKNLKKIFDRAKKHLTFTTSVSDALSNADFIFITVGTPYSDIADNGVEMSAFWNSVQNVINYSKRECLIILKSTVPVGTNSEVVKFIETNTYTANMHVVSNPEFLSQGSSIVDTIKASRIVIGINDNYSKEKMSKLYKNFPGKKIFTDPISAELIKYSANCYLAMRISFFNEIANMCEMTGANVEDVIYGVTHDRRIGDHYCSPSFGYGGSCFPKDTIALYKQFKSRFKYELKLVNATIAINDRQKMKLCEKIHNQCSGKLNEWIAVLGLTFKPNTDDLRYSVALDSINYFLSFGHKVVVWDPVALRIAHKYFKTKIKYCSSLETAILMSKYILISTDWPQIKNIDLSIFNGKKVFDGRNCLLKFKDSIDFEYTFIGGSKNL